MSVTLTDYGNVSVNTLVKSNVSVNPSLFSVTLWTPSEIDLSVNSSSGAHLLKLFGQFNLSSVGTTPSTLADFIYDASLGTVSSFSNYVNGTLGFTENFGSISFSNLLSLLGVNGTSAQSAALNSVFSGNDVYHTSNDATGTNSVTVNLYGGNNTFYENHPLLQYNDIFYGGSSTGINTAVLPGNASNYTISSSPVYDVNTGTSDLSGYTITDKTGATNTLEVYQVERLQFANTSLALDMAPTQSGGQAAEILGAAFGTSAVSNTTYAGIAIKLFDSGQTMAQVAQLAVGTGLMPTSSNSAFVSAVWQNVVGSPIDPGNLATFTGLLNNHTFTEASLLAMAATTSINQTHIGLTGLATHGLEFLPA